jgi:hypothetical protein
VTLARRWTEQAAEQLGSIAEYISVASSLQLTSDWRKPPSAPLIMFARR